MSDIETRQKKLPVLLFIRGEQYFDDVDPDATELTTEGTLELTEEGLLLTYQETALTGMEGTTTTFEVSGSQVILRRVGSVNSQMVFEEGRQHTSLYETPYGELSVDIQTSALRHNLSERGGVLGDTLASVLAACGADVTREFYVNDAGHQIDKFAHSIEARYLQIIRGEDAVPFPEDGYQGEDIKDLARAYYEKNGDKLLDVPEAERQEALAQFGLSINLPKMKTDLERYKIHYDNWFYESSLHESGYVKETVDLLAERGWTYEKDGALWLRTADILRDHYRRQGKKEADIEKLDLKDDVLRRANGFYTYFAADIAYHRNKFAVRGFDKVINIWGADHHGHVARLKGALDALGLNGSERLDIVLMQLVKLLRDGEVVRMSKRTGKAISLSDLLDEVSVDAARWYFNAKPDTQMEFDLGLAVREDSENPIYYVEYAHARICSLLRALAEEGTSVPRQADVDMSLLSGEAERALLKQIAQFCEEIKLAARDYDPSHINRYLQELAACFHRFYTACRIKGEEPAVRDARLKLADDTRIVLRNGLKLIGVDAPEKM